MPEEEEEEAAVEPEHKREANQRKFSWSPVPVNTHLMYRGGRSGTPAHHQSMADIRVAEEEVKRRRSVDVLSCHGYYRCLLSIGRMILACSYIHIDKIT